MAKLLHSFTLDSDVSMKLEQIENKSALINELLKTYFCTTNYNATALEQARAKMKILQEQLDKEKEQASKIILDEKIREDEIAQTEQEKIKEKEAKERAEKQRLIKDEQDIAYLTEKLGRKPIGKEIVEYHFKDFNK